MKSRKNKKTHSVFNLNIFKLLSIILIFLILIFLPLLLKSTVKINKVECQAQTGSCPSEFENYLKSFTGLNYYVVKKNLESYLDNYYLVDSYLMQFKLPNIVKLDLNLKNATSSIFLPPLNKYYFLTEDGVVVDIKDKTDLPNTVVNSQKLVKEYTFGDTLSEEVIFTSNIVKNLKYLYSINLVLLFDDYIEATTSESIKLIYPTSGDIDLLIGSTRLIFSRLNQGVEGIRMNEVGEIDLRYKNPIIRKK